MARRHKSVPMVRTGEAQWPASIRQAACIVPDRPVQCERLAWTLGAHRQPQPIPICARPARRKVVSLRWPAVVVHAEASARHRK